MGALSELDAADGRFVVVGFDIGDSEAVVDRQVHVAPAPVLGLAAIAAAPARWAPARLLDADLNQLAGVRAFVAADHPTGRSRPAGSLNDQICAPSRAPRRCGSRSSAVPTASSARNRHTRSSAGFGVRVEDKR